MQEGKKIRLCAVTTISKTMDWFLVDSMRNLAKNGYEITLVCSMEDDFVKRNEDFAKCIPFPMSRGVSVKDLFGCTKRLKRLFKEVK